MYLNFSCNLTQTFVALCGEVCLHDFAIRHALTAQLRVGQQNLSLEIAFNRLLFMRRSRQLVKSRYGFSIILQELFELFAVRRVVVAPLAFFQVKHKVFAFLHPVFPDFVGDSITSIDAVMLVVGDHSHRYPGLPLRIGEHDSVHAVFRLDAISTHSRSFDRFQ